jgi:hypothetical protein
VEPVFVLTGEIDLASRAANLEAAEAFCESASGPILQLLHITGLTEVFAVDPPIRPIQTVELPPVPPLDESDVPLPGSDWPTPCPGRPMYVNHRNSGI